MGGEGGEVLIIFSLGYSERSLPPRMVQGRTYILTVFFLGGGHVPSYQPCLMLFERVVTFFAYFCFDIYLDMACTACSACQVKNEVHNGISKI